MATTYVIIASPQFFLWLQVLFMVCLGILAYRFYKRTLEKTNEKMKELVVPILLDKYEGTSYFYNRDTKGYKEYKKAWQALVDLYEENIPKAILEKMQKIHLDHSRKMPQMYTAHIVVFGHSVGVGVRHTFKPLKSSNGVISSEISEKEILERLKEIGEYYYTTTLPTLLEDEINAIRQREIR